MGAAPSAGRRPSLVRPSLGLALLALWACSGCQSAGQAEADALARALARRVRIFYERQLAAEEGRAGPSPDERAEQAGAESQLADALSAAGLRPGVAALTSAARPGWGAAVARARNLLLAQGYVFPPVSPGDPGICLARVRSRELGLGRSLWGRRLRYRRVVHASPLLSDYATFRALRTGRGPLPPAARLARPTVFLDADAITRRAGRGPYLGVSPAQLRAHLELVQVAALRFRAEAEAAEQAGLAGPGRGPALIAALARVWLTLLRYGEGDLSWRRLQWELAQPPTEPERPWRAAARWVAERLPPSEGAPPAERARARAPELLALLERNEARPR